jgi:hypothetical protein
MKPDQSALAPRINFFPGKKPAQFADTVSKLNHSVVSDGAAVNKFAARKARVVNDAWDIAKALRPVDTPVKAPVPCAG